MKLTKLLAKHLTLTEKEIEKLKELEALNHFDRAKFFELYCYFKSTSEETSSAQRDWMKISQSYSKALITYESSKNDREKDILLRFMDTGSDEVDTPSWLDETDKEKETT